MQTIELESKGPVAWVWLNQPSKLNVIQPLTLEEIWRAFDELERTETVRVIVLAARGPAFSAGFDISSMVLLTPQQVVQDLDGVGAIYNAIEQCPKPVIAAVNGAAMGGGLLLALVADFRLAAERASFGAPEVKIGIFPSLNLIPRLERLVGLGHAKSLVMTGAPIDATQALRIGLVNRLIAPEKLQSESQALAEQLSELPPLAVRLCKSAFLASTFLNYSAWEKEQFAGCWASPDREKAMRAFLSGR
jgi:enoyl-CoA hydratase/carnithine racemase